MAENFPNLGRDLKKKKKENNNNNNNFTPQATRKRKTN